MCDWDPMDLATPDFERVSEVFDLEDKDDVELLGELLDTVLGQAPDALAALIAAQKQGDRAAVDKVAHGLKSSFGNVGYLQASQLFQRIMEEARSPSCAELDELIAQLEKGSSELLRGLQDFRDQL
ncbi:MAG: hypothetical protein CSA62_08795 [Planctomycetota bacterium]|nr:MAG: hypothetical protein CSA62_08795 [Planctomycetota bacterium]